jgi:hypothetical protein
MFNSSKANFKKPPFLNSSKFSKDDTLFNKKKISSDIISSRSSSSASSVSSASSASSVSSASSSISSSSGNKKYNINKNDDDDDIDEEIDDDAEEYDDDYGNGNNGNNGNDGNDDDEDQDYDDDDDMMQNVHRFNKSKKSSDKHRSNDLSEKRELLYQMDRLESKGYKLPFKFDMESNLEEMQTEYNKILREKEIDASIRFQRKMLMAFVSGSEYINTRYDPFAIKLDGWSEQVHDNILDYDDIFEELHSKYKSKGKKMSPELRLFVSLSGSAFMFHLTNRMFKDNPLPNVENVLKSNPELMKKFQEAAAKQYISGNVSQSEYGNTRSNKPSNGMEDMMSGGLFGMVGNLFNNMSGGSSRKQSNHYDNDDDSISSNNNTYTKRNINDIDNIINNVHSNISLNKYSDNIETLSVSDEEITSIIEDTADIKILRNQKKNKNSRTLNI